MERRQFIQRVLPTAGLTGLVLSSLGCKNDEEAIKQVITEYNDVCNILTDGQISEQEINKRLTFFQNHSTEEFARRAGFSQPPTYEESKKFLISEKEFRQEDVERNLEELRLESSIDINQINIQGDHATAICYEETTFSRPSSTGTEKKDIQIRLTKTKNKWKMDGQKIIEIYQRP